MMSILLGVVLGATGVVLGLIALSAVLTRWCDNNPDICNEDPDGFA